MRRIYIAGPITAPTHEEMILNTKRFDEIEAFLREHRWETLNPVRQVGHDIRAEDFKMQPWHTYLREDIHLLVSADAIYMMRGWWASKGATLEHHIAKELGFEILYEED